MTGGGIQLKFCPVELATSLLYDLLAGEKAPPVGYANNLIVEASTEYSVKRADGTLDPNKRRASLGLMPALPFEIVAP